MLQKRVVRPWMMSVSALVLAATFAGQAQADSFDVAGLPLIFSGSGTGSGTTVNSYRDYTNVITIGGRRIDARVTLVSLSGATLSAFDSTTLPYAQGAFFQPNLSISSAGGYAMFRVDFFDENGQPATLQNFYVNTYDLDGAGGSASGRQFTDFTGFASYALAAGTKVTAQSISGGRRFITTVGSNLEYTPG